MKIAIIEYKNIISVNHIPLGHGIKVFKEAIELCQTNNYDVKILGSKSYLDRIYFNCQQEKLPNEFLEGDSSPYKFYKWYTNIHCAIHKAKDCDVIWFTNVDWRVFLYMGFHPLLKKRMILTEYKDSKKYISDLGLKRGLLGRVIRNLCYKGFEKFSVYIQTYDRNFKNEKYMYMPDYLYKTQNVGVKEKIKRAICIGTINNTQKDILGLINVFKNYDFPLLIAGVFTDESFFRTVSEMKTDNITIINRELSEVEYTQMLSESLYSILPYKMNVYKNATSGVLRESLYLGVKVIAPQQLLQNMNIDGVGYTDIAQIPYYIENDLNLPNFNNIDHISFNTIASDLKMYVDLNCISY